MKKTGIAPIEIGELHIADHNDAEYSVEHMLLSISEYFPYSKVHYWTSCPDNYELPGINYHLGPIPQYIHFRAKAVIIDLTEPGGGAVSYDKHRSSSNLICVAHLGEYEKPEIAYDRIYFRLCETKTLLYVWLNHKHYLKGKKSGILPNSKVCFTLEQRLNWFQKVRGKKFRFEKHYKEKKLSQFSVYPAMFAVFLKKTPHCYFSKLRFFGNCKTCKLKNYLGVWAKCHVCAMKSYLRDPCTVT